MPFAPDARPCGQHHTQTTGPSMTTHRRRAITAPRVALIVGSDAANDGLFAFYVNSPVLTAGGPAVYFFIVPRKGTPRTCPWYSFRKSGRRRHHRVRRTWPCGRIPIRQGGPHRPTSRFPRDGTLLRGKVWSRPDLNRAVCLLLSASTGREQHQTTDGGRERHPSFGAAGRSSVT